MTRGMKVQRPLVDGHVEDGWGAVADAVRAALARHEDLGMACCVSVAGRVVLDMWGGTADPVTSQAYTGETLQLLHTATTAAVAVCGAILVDRGELDLDAPVAAYWPEFAAAGKEHIPVQWLFTHQAGLAGLDDALSPDDILGVAPATDALARQRPRWAPGTAQGYNPVTFGWLVGELVRRCTGHTIGAFFANEVATAHGLEFWIGLPGSLEWRVAPLLSVASGGGNGSHRSGHGWDALGAGALVDGGGDNSPLNSRAFRATEVPGVNGIATARALSGMYAAAIGSLPGTRLLSSRAVELVAQEAVDGFDTVLRRRTRFGLGFSLPTEDHPLLGPASFGCMGIGNAVGCADVDGQVAVGYVTNRLAMVPATPVGGDEVLAAVRECLGR